MRLFIAVEADEEVKAAAAAVVSRLRRVPGDYRWVEPRDMHVTLRFLGEVPEERLGQIEGLMRRAAARTAPFELVYGGVGAFESVEDPRVVWIGLSEGEPALRRLSGLLGYDEPRPYSAHMTLGRRRRDLPGGAFAAALRAQPPLALRRQVRELCLYASRPASFGHVYEILRREPLSGRPDNLV